MRTFILFISITLVQLASAAFLANVNLKEKRFQKETDLVTLSPTSSASLSSSMGYTMSTSTLSFPVISPTLIVEKVAANANRNPSTNYKVIPSASTLYPKSYSSAYSFTVSSEKAVQTKAFDTINFNQGPKLDQSKPGAVSYTVSSVNINVNNDIPEYVLAL
ncbi:hypothetical protein DASC09_052540 [Saccharomycopsis crataegensis]|uniref:Uncharacterized protein n=1 Tax=Saccharomycopsis crataegensis TaxID=43959 RepID=A0AAV5QT65_9ASCO|nr:hypothetical protein DASC09_052540 [Saccharomycopsis crataegensis]